MAINAIDEGAYDTAATAISYYKIFPYIVADFLTREDAKVMIKSTNLTVAVTAVGTATVVGAAGPMTGAAIVPVSTQVVTVYDGSFQTPGTKILEQQIKAKKLTGDASITGMTSTLESTMG